MEHPFTNSTPVANDPVPRGGYITSKLAGRKRFEDNADVLNVKCLRSENINHPPHLRLDWNDKPEVGGAGSEIGPPYAQITQAGQSSRETKSMPRASKRGNNVKRVATQLGSAEPSNAAHDRHFQAGQGPHGVLPARGIHIPSSEYLPGAHSQQMQELPQHHELLQQLLQQPSQRQHQQLSPSLQLQQDLHGPLPQSQQPLPFPGSQQQRQDVQPSQGQQHQQSQPLPPPSSSPWQYDRQLPPRPDVPSRNQFHQHLQPSLVQTPPQFQTQHSPPFPGYQREGRDLQQSQGQQYQQSQPLPPPPSSPWQHDRQLPPRPDVPSQNQFHQQQHKSQPMVYPAVMHQPPPPQHWPQQQAYGSIQGASEVQSTLQVGIEAPQFTAPRDERTQQVNNTVYESVLIQLIQRVGFASTGRIMTQGEAIDSWNQLDDEKKRNLHDNVCIALAQFHGPHDGGSSVVPTSHPTSTPVTSDQHVHSPHDHDMAGREVHTVADGEMELSAAPQGSELGFGLERMEETHAASASTHSNMTDFDEEETVQDSNNTVRPAEREVDDIVMRNVEMSCHVNVDEDYPSGVDGFGFPVDDAEDNRINASQVENVADAIESRDAGLRANRGSDPLLLVLIGKFGTLVDAVNRQTDAIQSMENYVEESRKILAQVAPAGNAAGGNGDSTSNNDAAQNVVPPGIAKKIQGRVAQITGQVVERSPGEADKASLKLLKERVRSHLLTLLGVPSLDLLVMRCRPFTQDEIDGYLADDGSVECTPHSFRIDFEREWKRFCINKEAREVFIENFLDVIMGSGMAQDQTIPEHLLQRDIVGQILDIYVTGTLRKKYKELLQLAPQPQDGENDQEAKQRVQAAQKRHDEALRKAARVSRRTTTFVARSVVIAVTPSLQRHSLLFARLTALNMSEDESDGPRKAVPRKFRIIIAQWQSDKLRELLWELDRQYRADWDKTPKAKRRPGNTPRDRKLKPDSTSEPGVAPQGLWRNCYNSEWVSKLHRHDRNRLRIIDSDYDFPDLPQNVQPTASGQGAAST